ncbi:MAG: hypothetical protein ACTFAL_14300 [Candidatus Electronema sp. V4]
MLLPPAAQEQHRRARPFTAQGLFLGLISLCCGLLNAACLTP